MIKQDTNHKVLYRREMFSWCFFLERVHSYVHCSQLQTNKQKKITRPWPNKERAHNSAEEQRSTNHNLNKAEIFERRTWRRKDWNFLTIKNNNNWNFSLPVMSCERKDWNIALLNPKALLHDSKTYSNVFHFKLFLFFFPLSLFFCI